MSQSYCYKNINKNSKHISKLLRKEITKTDKIRGIKGRLPIFNEIQRIIVSSIKNS